MRACVPSTPYTDPEKGLLRAIEESEWLKQIQSIMQISGAVVDLLDVQGSSVMICLEDGWDFTTQVCMQNSTTILKIFWYLSAALGNTD